VGLPLVEDEGAVRWIMFDRPSILNAFTLEDLGVIGDAVRQVGPEIRAIVLTGVGERAFSAGMHVETFRDVSPGAGRRIIDQVGDCLGAIRLAPIATVAMVNGYCLGAAFEMALACDVRVAHPEVRFGLPEVRLGIPSVVEAALLPRYVGLSRAREMILTGGMYTAADLPLGFVNRLVPADRLRGATEDILRALTTPTREVIAAQKALFETWLNSGLAESIETSKQLFAEVFDLPATRAAIARYRQPRA
jgi:enoyl-CoA hydratase/carnithine racemase